jgi:WD40 repeat protein
LSDGTISIRHRDDPSYERRLTGHDEAVDALAAAPHDTRLVSISRDQTLRVWNHTTGECDPPIRLTARPWTVAWSADGSRLAVGEFSGEIRILDGNSFELRQTFKIEKSRATQLAFRPNGKQLAASRFGGISLFDLTDGGTTTVLPSKNWYWSIAWSPDGTRIAGGSPQGRIDLWDPDTQVKTSWSRPHGSWIDGLEFHPDGTRLASASKDRKVVVSRILGNELSGEGRLVFAGHEGWIWEARFLPGGEELVLYSEDGTVKIWDLHADSLSLAFEAHTNSVDAVAFSPDGRLFVSGGEQSHVALWDSSTGTLLKRLESPRISVTALVFHPDGKLVIGATRQKTVFVWNISEEQPAVRRLRGHTEEVRAVAIFPNTPQIVSGGWDCTLRVWDLETGREVRRIELDVRPESQVRSVAVTSKDTIISGHRDGQIRIWKTGHDEPVKFLSGHEEGVTDLAFHPDGSLLASASMDRTLRLWDTRTWEFKSTLTGHDDEIHSIAWSPDGSRIVSASLDHTVMLWSPTRAEHVLASVRQLRYGLRRGLEPQRRLANRFGRDQRRDSHLGDGSHQGTRPLEGRRQAARHKRAVDPRLSSNPLKKSFGREPALSVQSRPRQNSETTQVASVLARTI